MKLIIEDVLIKKNWFIAFHAEHIYTVDTLQALNQHSYNDCPPDTLCNQ